MISAPHDPNQPNYVTVPSIPERLTKAVKHISSYSKFDHLLFAVISNNRGAKRLEEIVLSLFVKILRSAMATKILNRILNTSKHLSFLRKRTTRLEILLSSLAFEGTPMLKVTVSLSALPCDPQKMRTVSFLSVFIRSYISDLWGKKNIPSFS